MANELAYQIAGEQFAQIDDIEEQCRKSGANYLPDQNAVTIDYLAKTFRIDYPDIVVSLVDSDEEVPIRDKILILHYFTRASGVPLSGQIITYKELHDGINYYPTFFKRAIAPIVDNFGREPQRLLDIAGMLGGQPVDYGDVAVTIPALPYVPIIPVLWKGDDEFPADGNILFDSTITDYLPTEDITILSEVIAWKLVRLLKTGGDTPG